MICGCRTNFNFVPTTRRRWFPSRMTDYLSFGYWVQVTGRR